VKVVNDPYTGRRPISQSRERAVLATHEAWLYGSLLILALSNGRKIGVVPPVGIEPTLLSEPDFESGASTSSTTGAPQLRGRFV
jgi:hypothetical protein